MNDAPTYNLKAVVNETGLNPATIRAWERRYHLFKPHRSEGGHRQFSEDEINLLKWLVDRQSEGLSISRAVELWHRKSSNNLEHNEIPARAATGEGTLVQLRKEWREACLSFNEVDAELATAKALAIASPEVVCTQILQTGLAEIGEGWYSGTVSVQQEHFASALVSRRLFSLFSVAPKPTKSKRILAACPPGEDHDLALLMLSFIMRWQGWEVIYLGADVPLEQLDATITATSPQLVLTVAQTLPAAAALRELAIFCSERSIPLAYGGGVFKQIPGLFERIPGHYLGSQIESAPQVIEHLLTYHPMVPVSKPILAEFSVALNEYKALEGMIISRVREILKSSFIDPHYIDVANKNFSRALIAALALGDLAYLDHSVNWLNGLLINYGLPPKLAGQYYQAFDQAIKDHPGIHTSLISKWLTHFKN